MPRVDLQQVVLGVQEAITRVVGAALLSQTRMLYKPGLMPYEEVEGTSLSFHRFDCTRYDYETLYLGSLHFKTGNSSCFVGSQFPGHAGTIVEFINIFLLLNSLVPISNS